MFALIIILIKDYINLHQNFYYIFLLEIMVFNIYDYHIIFLAIYNIKYISIDF